MNPKLLRIKAIAAEIRAIATPLQIAGKAFTADQETRINDLLAEAAKLKVDIDADATTAAKSRSAKTAADLESFLRGDAAGDDRRAGRKTRGPSWTAALGEARPDLGIEPGRKGLVIPPSTTFTVPAPAPIAAANIPFGHMLDVITVDSTLDGAMVSYLRSVNRQAAATVVAPGTLKPSKNVTLNRVNAPAVTIAVLLEDIRKQDLDDYASLVSFLDFELQGDVLTALDHQILLGTGYDADDPDESQIAGIFLTEGVTHQAFGTTPSATIRRAQAKVEALGYGNTAVVVNPLDLAELELETDGAGAYRGDLAVATRGPRQVWGVPAASVAACPQGLAIVGDLTQVALWIRQQIEVQITDSVVDNFKRNLYTARAEMRAAGGVPVPSALAIAQLDATVAFPAESAPPGA